MYEVSALQNTLRSIPVDSNGYATLGGRPKSDRRPIIAEAVYNASNGQCVICGYDVDIRTTHGARSFQLGHIVPGGPKRMGWVPGNISTQCGACNVSASDTNLIEFIPMFALPQSILTVWPMGRETKKIIDEYAIRRDARASRSLPF